MIIGQTRMRDDGVDRALAQRAAGEIDARNPRMGGERHDPRIGAEIGRRQAVTDLSQSDDRTTFGRVVGERGEQHRFGQDVLRDVAHGDELVGHAIAEGDRAGFIEQQRIDVAGRLDRAARSGDDVETDQTIHAGDADRR